MKRLAATGLILATMLGVRPVHADGGALQAQIQATYARAAEAMRYKYTDGVMGIRSPTFRAYDGAGHLVNPAAEASTLEQFFKSATCVTETTTIEHFVQTSDHEVRVRIKDVVEFDQPSSSGHAKPPVVVRTTADDTWVLQGNQWKLSTSHVLQQSYDNV